MSPQTCPSCGYNAPDSAHFCKKCGKEIQTPDQTPVIALKNTSDPMKAWWIVFGIILFVSLFTPLGMENGQLKMFWNLLDTNFYSAIWIIINASLGLFMFILSIIFSRGIVRGCIMAVFGLAGLILYNTLVVNFASLAFSFSAFSFILSGLGLICVGVLLGSTILRQAKPDRLLPKLTGSISGGLAILMFIYGAIVLLVNIRGDWTLILSNILLNVFSLIPVIAGIIALATLGKPQSLPKLLKSINILIWVYFGCLLLWYILFVVLAGLNHAAPVQEIFMFILPITIHVLCWIIYTLAIGFGFTEIFS